MAQVIGGADKAQVVAIHARYDEKYSRDLVADFDSELGACACTPSQLASSSNHQTQPSATTDG